MKIVAILTGRGGSSLKDKNVLPILGHPLLFYPALAAKNCKHIEHFYVSSDDEKILTTGAEVGYKPIRRPPELSKPDSQHVDAITHALGVIKEMDQIEPDILVVLLANTVNVKVEWLDGCIEQILDDPTISSAVPVYQDSNHHPFRAKRIRGDGFLDTFIDFQGKRISTNRQDLDPSYFLCHNFWVLNLKEALRPDGQQPWFFLGNRIKPYLVEDSIDVHTQDDINECEKWLIRNNIFKLIYSHIT